MYQKIITQKLYFTVIYLSLLLLSEKNLAQQTHFWHQAEWHYRNGLELIEKEHFLSAQQNFEAYIRLTNGQDLEKQGEAYYYRAYCALQTRDANANALLDDFTMRFPDHPLSINAYYLWGKSYYESYDYAQAITLLQKIPLNSLDYFKASEVQYMLGKSHFYNQNYEIADQYFETLKKGSSRYVVSANYYSGYIAYQAMQYEEALQDLRKASEHKEKSYVFDAQDAEFEKQEIEKYQLSVPIVVAKIYYETQRYEENINYLLPLLLQEKNYEQIADLHLLLAESYYFLAEYYEAANYYPRYIGLTPDMSAIRPTVYYNAGRTMFEIGDNEKAVEYLSKAALEESLSGQYAAYYLGQSYLALEKSQFAVAALLQASRLDYDAFLQREATFLLGQVYYNTEQYLEAIETLALVENLRGEKPDDKWERSQELIAQAYLYSRDYDQTIAYIEGIKQKNNSVSAKLKEVYQLVTFSQGLEYFNQEKYPEAVGYFEKSIFTYTPSETILLQTAYWLAESYVLKGYAKDTDFKNILQTKAIPLYQKVLEKNADNTDYGRKTLYGLGYAYYNLKDYNSSKTYFNRYLQALRGKNEQEFSEDALLRIADCEYAQKNYGQALTLYSRAITEQFADIDYAYYQKGMLQFFDGQATNAKESFDAIIFNIPNSPYYDYALFQKGIVDLKGSKFSLSIQHFSQLIQEKPDSKLLPEALLNRGLAYQNIDNDAKAIQDYSRILEQYAQHPAAESALFGLQTLLQKTGKDAEFQQYVSLYRAANPNSEALESIDFDNARQAFFNQNYSASISRLKAFMEKYPQSSYNFDAKYFIAESYRQSGDIDNALAFYYQVIQDRKSNYLGRTFQRVADIERSQGNYQKAIENYLVLSDITDSKREQLLAWEGIMQAYYAMEKYDSSLVFAEGIIEKSQTPSITLNAQLYQGKSSMQLRNYSQAAKTLQEVAQNTNTLIGAEAQYFWAKTLYLQKEYDQSLEILFELNKQYASALYEKWRGEAFFLIAENYLAKGETFQAKSTLQSILERSQDEELKERSQTLLNSL